MHDIFISYSSKDQMIADAIVNILESRKIKCWISYRDASHGKHFAESIEQAIENSKICVLIFSNDSNQSDFVLKEVDSCAEYKKMVIPFKIDNALMRKALAFHLRSAHWLEALSRPLEEHINKLADKLEEALSNNATKHTKISGNDKILNVSDTRMVKYDDLIKLGYNADKIAVQLVENDYQNFNGISEDNEGTPDQWAQFIQNSTETFQYMINGENKIIGDWSIVALYEDDFQKAKEGVLLEKDIIYERCDVLALPGLYYGYVLVFSLLPNYRNMQNYMMLMESFYMQLQEYAEHGIFFKEWCMNVFTPEVEGIIKKLGFKYLVNNKSLGKIYHKVFIPLPKNPMLNKFPRLQQLYEEVTK